ncbi:MAG: tRNA preQ1(34) S-adenosylmethionine ribosyltransferase-isomerase QueA [Candidatus Moranbacteria bacterium]|nr:tRNA preQ1(34) S-adenosylmethionine ribosyltransferase-isomerase QueA [Candidatus Moranbacteria bacterium]
MMKLTDLNGYEYTLPLELIRRQGVEPRDSARLFVYDTETDTVTFDIFRNLATYLPAQSLVVLNDTRVLPVRLWLTKETGGKIEVFVLMNQRANDDQIPVLVDRKVSIGQKLFFPNGDFLDVNGQDEQIFFVRVVSQDQLSIAQLLERYGQTPLPRYLEGAGISEHILRERYQTVFARAGSSVAAPTAGLHFTDEVFASLSKKDIQLTTVTLDVGRGTFSPLVEQNFVSKTLHTEYISVSDDAARDLNRAKANGHSIVAVGTTALRTLESVCQAGRFSAFSGPTDIFIFPPHHFEGADMLLTNFHLPKTSLMLLVDAFLRDKGAKRDIVSLYQLAIENRFAFYSFGDSMLIV